MTSFVFMQSSPYRQIQLFFATLRDRQVCSFLTPFSLLETIEPVAAIDYKKYIKIRVKTQWQTVDPEAIEKKKTKRNGADLKAAPFLLPSKTALDYFAMTRTISRTLFE